jgi:hypothetical protein
VTEMQLSKYEDTDNEIEKRGNKHENSPKKKEKASENDSPYKRAHEARL